MVFFFKIKRFKPAITWPVEVRTRSDEFTIFASCRFQKNYVSFFPFANGRFQQFYVSFFSFGNVHWQCFTMFFLSANYFKFCLSFADLLWLPLPFPTEPLTTQKYLCFFEVFCFCFVCFLISYSYWHFWIDSERTHWQCVDFPGLLKCQFQVKQTFISFQKHHGKKVEKLCAQTSDATLKLS